MQDFDNYDPNQKEIKDIYTEEIDKELTYHFPVEVLEMEKQLKELFDRKFSKKKINDMLMEMVDKVLEENDKEKFNSLCKLYQHVQKEYRYY